MDQCEEKHIPDSADVIQDAVDNVQSPLAWTDREERALVRKIDILVMPLLIMAFFCLQLDRSNIGNAITDFFMQDVGINQNEFNVGQQLLSAGVLILEIPSNMILYRIGPSLWIGVQIIAWGLVATFQAFQNGLPTFLATRLLLGLCEAGFIPASLFTLGRWYKRDEISKRFAWFFMGNGIASGCSGLMAYGILHMRGVGNLAGWQWLFMLEGILTILVGIAFLSLFPDRTLKPSSLLGFNMFTKREAQILHLRILRDDPAKAHPARHISLRELTNALTNYRLLPHIILTILALAPTTTMGSYAPSLVSSFGYDRIQANAMVSVGSWIGILINIFWGYMADRVGVRGPFVFISLLIFFALHIGNRLLITSTNSTARFAILTLSMGFSGPWHPVNTSWMSLNSRSAAERSINLAIIMMAASSSGLIGKQLFRSEDAPIYKNGWTIIVGLLAGSVVAGMSALLQYYLLNERRLKRTGNRYQY